MDIIDVILARMMTPQGQIESYAAMAQNAVQQATAALKTANDTQDVLNNLLKDVDTADEFIASEMKKATLSVNTHTGTNSIINDLITTYADTSTKTTANVVKYYTTTGQNEDGTMTQKAITNAIGSGGGGSTNLGPENSGNIVVVGPDGNIISGTTSEEEIIEALVKSGAYTVDDAVGLEIDYENRTYVRTQEAENYTAGTNFDKYPMFGGRKRCNVADDGTINAFYGDPGYTEDGSNGQVMVYQPKFYYQRIPIKTDNIYTGRVIRKESIILSDTEQTGFKLHPLFKNENGETIDYVLISAYDNCAYKTDAGVYDLYDDWNIDFSKDKLSSIAGAKPISGVNKNFTIQNAEQMAKNRGTGWHITNLAFESALQFLELVEFGTLNSQNALEAGISTIPNNTTKNCSSLTGSTAALGNTTGAATETINEINGNYNTYNYAGRRAINYRGMENPWGNMWRLVGGLSVNGNGNQNAGVPYVCGDFNYNYSTVYADNYVDLNVTIPFSEDYISGFGYGKTDFDWVFIPIECNNGNSAVPVGDTIWTTKNLSTLHTVMIGGSWTFGDKEGAFCYAFDQVMGYKGRSLSARVMFVPLKNEIYTANIAKWQATMAG